MTHPRSGAGEPVIRMASLMADNAAFWYREISRYLARRTGLRFEVVENVPWQERERMLDRGEVQLAFIIADGAYDAIRAMTIQAQPVRL